MRRLLAAILIASSTLAGNTSHDPRLRPRQIVSGLVSGLGSTTGSLVGGVAGTVGGVLNVTTQSVANVLTPTLTALLSSAPLTVLSGLLQAVQVPHRLDPNSLGWQYYGCYLTSGYIGTLQLADSSSTSTPELCIALCVSRGNEVAAIRGSSCYCRDDTPVVTAGSDLCTTSCGTNNYCGGSGAISVFRRAITARPGPIPAQLDPLRWRYTGCYYVDANVLASATVQTYASGTVVSAAVCTVFCSGKTYSALYNNNCYCTNTYPAKAQAGVGLCGLPCQGNSTEACGTDVTTGSLGGKTKTIQLYAKASLPPTTVPQGFNTTGPSGWQYLGCYYGALYLLDAIFSGIRISALLDVSASVLGMSNDRCVTLCIQASVAPNPLFNYALTLGNTCFCHTRPPTYDLVAPNQSLCNTPCYKSETQRCGGSDPAPLLAALGNTLITIEGRSALPVSGFRFLDNGYGMLEICDLDVWQRQNDVTSSRIKFLNLLARSAAAQGWEARLQQRMS